MAINRFLQPMRYLIYGLAVVALVVCAWALIRMFGFFGRAGGQTGRLRVLGNGSPLSSNGSGTVFQIHLHAETDIGPLLSVGQPLARGWGQRTGSGSSSSS